MKRGRLLLALAALVSVGVVTLWHMQRSTHEEAPERPSLDAEGAEPRSDMSATAQVPTRPMGKVGQPSLPAIHRETVQVGDALWGATTPEQAAWLNRNGYPTSAQLAAFNGAQAAQLPSDGIARSPADVATAESVAMSDPAAKEQALALLKNASESGSSYALQSLARIAQLSEGDAVKAEGYYRAALLRGDWVAGLREIPRLSPEQNYAADLRAFRIIEQINSSRRQHGLPPLAADVRPGAEDALDTLVSGGK